MAFFLYNIGDAEQVSKATVCQAVKNVTFALKQLKLYTFVLFPTSQGNMELRVSV